MPALWLALTASGWRTWLSTCAMVAVLPLGNTVTLWPTCACPVAKRPQKTRRPWLVSLEPENFSTHCTGKASGKASSAGVTGNCSSRRSRLAPW